MTNPVFPTLSNNQRPDSSRFDVSIANPSMMAKTEGGYTFSRAKYQRAPRKTWNISYSTLTGSQKTVIENFWNTVKGGSVIFNWFCFQDGVTYAVRFAGDGPLNFKYTGMGDTQLWDCSFSVEQA